MEAFLKPLSEAERIAQLYRFSAEVQQYADELSAKRKQHSPKKSEDGPNPNFFFDQNRVFSVRIKEKCM